ncbi:hypothetical protein [Actinoplanes sp. NPDC049802]|uniref:hypothetical protein n=1 Tax=Actinoplanes sp. NPDC049802 TaxID=3154742 RepID=UPI0034023F2E
MTVTGTAATGAGNIAPGRILRLVIGQMSLTAGVFWLVMALTVPYPRDFFVGGALAAGGLALLLWRRLRPPVRFVSVTAAMTAIGGTAAGLAVHTTSMGGMFGWFESRGWPFAWAGLGGLADTTEEAHRQAVADGWGLDWFRLLVDVTLWAYAGLVVAVVIGLAWRALRK